jgi:membrane-anchored protein YejM (alkaline phosphatase superfamily)
LCLESFSEHHHCKLILSNLFIMSKVTPQFDTKVIDWSFPWALLQEEFNTQSHVFFRQPSHQWWGQCTTFLSFIHVQLVIFGSSTFNSFVETTLSLSLPLSMLLPPFMFQDHFHVISKIYTCFSNPSYD